MEAKYKLGRNGSVPNRVLKDGHTMFFEDIVKDLNRKSLLEAQLKQAHLCDTQLQDKCDNLRADRMELEASNNELRKALTDLEEACTSSSVATIHDAPCRERARELIAKMGEA